MKITNRINREALQNQLIGDPTTHILKELGFKDVKREITLFFIENKNVHNIINNNMVTSINATITNYSIHDTFSNNKELMYRMFTKTIYWCEVEFPGHISLKNIKENIDAFIESAEINPQNAFSNTIVVTNDWENRIVDCGLCIADLNTSRPDKIELVTFVNDNDSELVKQIIYYNPYNPKYYNHIDAEYYKHSNETRRGNLNDFVTDNTKILYNTLGRSQLDTFINNNPQTGVYIDNRTILVNDLISELFGSLIFINMDSIEFIYDTRHTPKLMINNISFFSRFPQEVTDYYITKISDSVMNNLNTFEDNIKETFYMVFNISKQFVILDIIFFKDNREIRYAKPLYKLYGEFTFSMKDDKITNMLENKITSTVGNIEQNKQTFIDKGTNIVKGISNAFGYIENRKKEIESKQSDRLRLSSLSEDRMWEENELYQ